MDLYVRVRVENTIFETNTSIHGGKTPTWNRVFNTYLPVGVESIYLQIFDKVRSKSLYIKTKIFKKFSVLLKMMNVLHGHMLSFQKEFLAKKLLMNGIPCRDRRFEFLYSPWKK